MGKINLITSFESILMESKLQPILPIKRNTKVVSVQAVNISKPNHLNKE
jgi:hypothetical protein